MRRGREYNAAKELKPVKVKGWGGRRVLVVAVIGGTGFQPQWLSDLRYANSV